MSDDLPKVIREETINILGQKLRVYILDDGKRVVNAEDVEKFFKEWSGDIK